MLFRGLLEETTSFQLAGEGPRLVLHKRMYHDPRFPDGLVRISRCLRRPKPLSSNVQVYDTFENYTPFSMICVTVGPHDPLSF